MSSQTDSETVPCCSLSFQVHFTVNIGKSRRSRSTVIPSQAADVRKRGPVRIEEYGANRSWFFKANWLELTNEQLLIYPSANRKPSFIASTRDILKVERTDIRRYGLIITTTNQQHLLTFKNEKELYDWFDKLYESDNGVSAPWNFVHHIHVGADAATGQFTGLPVGWRKALDLPPVYEASTTKKSDKVGVNIRIGTPSQDDPGHVSTTLSV
ncbi:hypothetical protein C8F01DRAFT_1255722 [Mycena amicta]|nr:hypothetical protein C8F01DRAFT_1255722 [Mycena amicta]